ncbi:hypothetical protein Aspvir_008090 [Aspergillus viridinutans]|uniref:N-acetyltransferase domain-containing protein n=1 Tax=Aspergillus viridinutans TaxID=75553 RepID=A0A9P3F729_ASPVI|nr:uncharacterized protein Aspvir_008090 [Aspergillus viridinutans]GIK04015.1 hypothetical protein Aspvir_008090 [Aspergillus viridinutans]
MTIPALNFRLATPSDAPQIQQLIQSAFRALDPRPNWTGDTTLSSSFHIETTEILSTITTPDSAFLLATDPTGALIASIGISRRGAHADDDAGLARFFMLAVDEAYQRGGIGRKILAYAEGYCQRKWGVSRGGLNALSTREELILWYSRCGYRRTGELTPFPVEKFKDMQLPEDLCFVEMEKKRWRENDHDPEGIDWWVLLFLSFHITQPALEEVPLPSGSNAKQKRATRVARAKSSATCQKRGHPQICVYDFEESSPRKRAMLSPQNSNADASHVTGLDGANDQPPIRNSASPLHIGLASGSVNQEDPANYVCSGENTVISLLGSHDTDGSITHKASSVLGLQNSFSNYPFIDLKTPRDRWKALVEILPQRQEILKFFHFYRTSTHPSNPILVDIDGFELVVCQFLASYASGELRDRDKISERWSSDRSVGQISLLLAALAFGSALLRP